MKIRGLGGADSAEDIQQDNAKMSSSDYTQMSTTILRNFPEKKRKVNRHETKDMEACEKRMKTEDDNGDTCDTTRELSVTTAFSSSMSSGEAINGKNNDCVEGSVQLNQTNSATITKMVR